MSDVPPPPPEPTPPTPPGPGIPPGQQPPAPPVGPPGPAGPGAGPGPGGRPQPPTLGLTLVMGVIFSVLCLCLTPFPMVLFGLTNSQRRMGAVILAVLCGTGLALLWRRSVIARSQGRVPFGTGFARFAMSSRRRLRLTALLLIVIVGGAALAIRRVAEPGLAQPTHGSHARMCNGEPVKVKVDRYEKGKSINVAYLEKDPPGLANTLTARYDGWRDKSPFLKTGDERTDGLLGNSGDVLLCLEYRDLGPSGATCKVGSGLQMAVHRSSARARIIEGRTGKQLDERELQGRDPKTVACEKDPSLLSLNQRVSVAAVDPTVLRTFLQPFMT